MASDLGLRVGRGTMASRDFRVPLGVLFGTLFDGVDPVLDPAERGKLHYLPEQRYWLLEELESLLEQAALRSPLLICLDDMQWADAGCQGALRNLPLRLAGLPIVWLVAYRPGRESADLRGTVEAMLRGGAVRCRLPPLEDAAIGQLALDVVGAEPDDGLLDLARRAHGSPFLLVELLHGLLDEGLVSVESGRARLLEARLPARIGDGMRERLGRLSDAAGQVARVASTLGRFFSFDQVAGMLDVAPVTLLGPVEELLVAELFSQDGDALTFRHDLLRDAVRDTLPATARRALQRQAVTVLLATGTSPVDVAFQLAASALPGDKAAVRALREAARALAGSDPSTAADLSRRALELVGDTDQVRGSLAAETTLLLHAAGRIGEGAAFADGVLADTLPPEQEAEVRLALAGMIGELSPDVRAEAGRRALALPGLSAPLHARHIAYLVHNLLVAGRRSEALTLLPQAREIVGAVADPAARCALELAEAGVADDLDGALTLVEAAARDCVQANDHSRALIARLYRTELLAMLDRYDESLAQIVDDLAKAQRDRQVWAVRLCEGYRGRRLVQLGRLADGAAALETVVSTEFGPVGVVYAAEVAALGAVAIHTGDRVRLRHCVSIVRGVLDSAASGPRHSAAWLLALEAMAAGDAATAREHLGEIDVTTPHPDLSPASLDVTDAVQLARIAVAAGDDHLARSVVAAATGRLRRNPDVASVAGSAAHARGLAGGDLADLMEAVRWFERGPRPLALASALEDAGRAALGHGRRDDGVEMLGRALETYARLGASWDAGRVRKRLRDVGVRRRLVTAERPARGWGALTASELEVVRRVAAGLTNRQVAEQLFVSPHTVSTHLRHAFGKLGVNSRIALAHLVSQHEDGAP